jgi:peptidoglycan/LPS O-acetylase OafA/YrhL
VAVTTKPQPSGLPTSTRRIFSLAGTRRGTIPQLPALDGLRGVAVLLVIAYHLGWRTVPGGFLGVEVFFVVSGYLITALIVAELDDRRYLDLGGFWSRRLRRLLPALFLMLGTVALIIPIVAPEAINRFRSDLPWSLLYLANWWQIFSERSYFEASTSPDLLQHLWSLAIEEQFYLLWPPVLAALYTRLGPRRWMLPIVSAGAAAASALAMYVMFDPGRDPSRVYFGTDTRASALLIGATLAFVWNPDVSKRLVNPPPIAVDIAGGLAIVALALSVNRYNGFDPPVYQGGFLLVSAATALLIVAGTSSRTLSAGLLSVGVLRAVGVRSYGLYLWHWPIFQLTRPGSDVSLSGWQLTFVRLALTVAAAEATWRLVERPLRRPRTSGRGAAAQRYRRAELVLAVVIPLMIVPYLVSGSNPANPLDSIASPSSGVSVGPDEAPATTSTPPETVLPSTPPASTPADPATSVPAGEVPGTTATPVSTTVSPTVPPAGGDGSNVLVVGDSVMLGASPAMLRRLPAADIDAVVGRQLRDAADLMSDLRTAGRMRPVVVLQLGNNGSATGGQLDELMSELSNADRVVVITANAPRAWTDTVNDRFRDLQSKHPNVQILDWHAVVDGEGGLVGDDGVHLTPLGAQRLSELVASAIAPP